MPGFKSKRAAANAKLAPYPNSTSNHSLLEKFYEEVGVQVTTADVTAARLEVRDIVKQAVK